MTEKEEVALDPEEIEDFELKELLYQVWAIGFASWDYDDPIQSRMLLETPDLDEAENLAKAVYEDPQDIADSFSDDIHYLVVDVDAIVDMDETGENFYNTYHRIIEITRK